MPHAIEFFFDIGSPTAYLAHTQLPAIARRAGADLIYRPMLLGGVFKATGNQTPMAIPAKGAYMVRDIARAARRFGVPLQSNPHFPVNTLAVMRGAVAAEREGDLAAYVAAMYRAMWVEARDLADPGEIAAVLAAAGLDPARYATLIQDQAVKDALKAATEAAVARGIFGAPTMFVAGEMFFGHDRLDQVAELAAAEDLPDWAA